MNRAIFPLVIFCLSAASFYSESSELALSEKSKAEIVSLLREGVTEGIITELQQSQTLVWLNQKPCIGIDRILKSQEKEALSIVVPRQVGLEKVEVYESFKKGSWSIIYTNAREGDETYLFYSGDPSGTSKPVTAWSGAATFFETTEISEWALSEAKGIPVELANCFAWHVTLGSW